MTVVMLLASILSPLPHASALDSPRYHVRRAAADRLHAMPPVSIVGLKLLRLHPSAEVQHAAERLRGAKVVQAMTWARDAMAAESRRIRPGLTYSWEAGLPGDLREQCGHAAATLAWLWRSSP